MQRLYKDQRILNFFLLFIIFQPVIDILTTFTIMKLNSGTSFGILIRCLYMLLSVFFILSQFNKQKVAKRITIYLFLLGAFVITNLYISYTQKPVFILTEEVIFFTKLVYGNIVLLNFILVFNYLKKEPEKFLKQFLRVFVSSSVIIGLVMVVSIATSTSISSYDYTKIGFTGWFYAGNEIGAILAIISPIVLYYAIKNTDHVKQLYYWIPFLLMAFSLVMVGTKVGYGALLILLIVSILSLLITYFISKRKTDIKGFRINIIITSLLLFILIVTTPLTPLYQNTFAHFDLIGVEYGNPADEDIDDSSQKPGKQRPQISNEQYENLILSSREIFLNVQKEYFSKAPSSQKLLGMGYAGNYTEEAKMIEMDFYDIFYSTGIIGTILFFLPYLLLGGRLVVAFLKNLRFIFLPKYSLFLSSILLTLGIAFIAGHVFTAPAVSIYVAAIFAFLVTNIPENEDEPIL